MPYDAEPEAPEMFGAQRTLERTRWYTPDELARVFDGFKTGRYIIDGPALVEHLRATDDRHKIGAYTFFPPRFRPERD